MKGFHRNNLLFSLCGLNCGLCPMKLDGHCPGCGGGEGNQSCRIARCAMERGGIEYCFQCKEYPCERYEGIDEFDSFIAHRNRMSDMEKAKQSGPEAYTEEQERKAELLKTMLSEYNDGRRKSLFCLAVNLLGLSDLESALEQAESWERENSPEKKEKAACLAKLLQAAAERSGMELRLRRKPRNL